MISLNRAGSPPGPRRARPARPALHDDASLHTWHNPSKIEEKDNHKAVLTDNLMESLHFPVPGAPPPP